MAPTAKNNLIVRLQQIREEYEVSRQEYDQYNEQHRSQELKVKHTQTALEVHQAMIGLIREQQRLNKSVKSRCLSFEEPIMDNIRDSLEEKMKCLEHTKEQLEKDLKQSQAAAKQTEREISQKFADLRQLTKKKDDILDELLKNGCSDQELELFVDRISSISPGNKNVSQDFISPANGRGDCNYATHYAAIAFSNHDNNADYVEECSREEALQWLTGQTNGTFLIRPSTSGDSPFSMSIAMYGNVYHCKIFQKNGLFGFCPQKMIYQDLKSLISFYQRNSLESYNPILKTCLSNRYKKNKKSF